jgi:sugar phosphate isomerase/epimerase
VELQQNLSGVQILIRFIEMKRKLFAIIVTGLVIVTFPMCTRKKLNNTFYAQNTLDGFKNAPHSALEKAKLLKTIGYDGLEGFGYRDFFELKNALDKEGLEMPVNYVELNFESDGKLEDTSANEIKAMIKASAKGAIIYFHLHSNRYKADKEAGDKVVSVTLRELSDYSASFGVKLCVYPHAGFYCETVAHSVKLAKMVGRGNYGAAMNLCHLLKVEGSEGIDIKIKEFSPFLFAVNICGADDGDTKQFGWDRLIQPLGNGSFDTYRFVKTLSDNGYRGPIGLQCYNLEGDALETLTRSLFTWKEYKKRYAEER